MSRLFVDTLFMVALVNSRDQYHQTALDLSAMYEGNDLLVTDGVLLEIGNTLARSFKAKSVEMIEGFQASEEIEIVSTTPMLFERGFELYKSHQDKSWGLVDCISFVVMREAGIDSALTFDQHFVQAGFRALMREALFER